MSIIKQTSRFTHLNESMGFYTRLPFTSILSLDVLIHALEAALWFVVIAFKSEPQEPGSRRDKVGELVAAELLDEL